MGRGGGRGELSHTYKATVVCHVIIREGPEKIKLEAPVAKLASKTVYHQASRQGCASMTQQGGLRKKQFGLGSLGDPA